MSAVLSPPRPSSFGFLQQPTAKQPAPSNASVNRLAPILCGSGLIVYGLLRGSWLGLTLAAAGGFLVYRGLRAPVEPVGRRRFAPGDESATSAGDGMLSAVYLPLNDGEAKIAQDVRQYEFSPTTLYPEPGRNAELTAQEHHEAEVAAYHRAQQRGGGSLPPYDHAQAIEDFRWAADRTIRRRPRGRAIE